MLGALFVVLMVQSGAPPVVSCDTYFPVKPNFDVNKSHKPATIQKKDDGKYYLFIIGVPSGGTTAMSGLLGTSPQASTLCDFIANGGLCEGTNWLLGSGLVPERKNMWQESFVVPWKRAVKQVYAKRWNMSKPVLLEKSPPNVGRVPEIYRALKDDPERKIRFLVVTMSSCLYCKNAGAAFHYRRFMKKLSTDLDTIPRSVWHHVTMEDMFRNPYTESDKILQWLPALRQLNPEKTALQRRNPSATTAMTRMMSVVDFIKHKGEMTKRSENFVPLDIQKKFGYVK
eukprot:Hpha_TRINITY_DN1592_c0_g1::TRINITY_DN1592_c0_g1_i1::g.57200::m.57200